MAVGGIGVGAVEGEVADERAGPAAVGGSGQDVAVGVAFGRADVVGAEDHAADLRALALAEQNRGIGRDRRPFLAVDRAPLGALRIGDLGDHLRDRGGGVHRDVTLPLALHESVDAVEVVRMRVRDEHPGQRPPQRIDPRDERGDVTVEQVGVDHDRTGLGLDDIGVHEQAGLAGSVRVDGQAGQ